MASDNQALLRFIKDTFPIPEHVAGSIADNFDPVVIPKYELTLSAGKINSDYLFLESGYMRSFVLDVDGHEVTTDIYKPNRMVFEVGSYFQRKPSKENIQAVTDCTAWVGKYENLQKIFHSLPEFREFGRAVLVSGFIAFKERTISMVNEKAEQRYEKMLAENPDIFQYVPLKFIASYLGITDTSLSRLRKEISKR